MSGMCGMWPKKGSKCYFGWERHTSFELSCQELSKYEISAKNVHAFSRKCRKTSFFDIKLLIKKISKFSEEIGEHLYTRTHSRTIATICSSGPGCFPVVQNGILYRRSTPLTSKEMSPHLGVSRQPGTGLKI